MESTLAYWLSAGQMVSPQVALIWLLAAVCLALNLKNP